MLGFSDNYQYIIYLINDGYSKMIGLPYWNPWQELSPEECDWPIIIRALISIDFERDLNPFKDLNQIISISHRVLKTFNDINSQYWGKLYLN